MNPAATDYGMRLSASEPGYLGVTSGHKVAVISNL